MIYEQIQRLLDKPVTRKEFLGHVSVIFLAFVGVSAIFRSISEITGHQSFPKKTLSSLTSQPAATGYGQTGYGV